MTSSQSTPLDTPGPSSELAEQRMRFDPADLRGVTSFQDAIDLVKQQLGAEEIHDATYEIGDGFTMLDDKSKLIDTPMLIIAWVWTLGDFGSDFLIMRVVTGEGKKYVVTDGSGVESGSGLAQQVREYEDRTGRTGGLLVNRGLRKSEYDNEHGHGVSYYLNV